MPYISFLVVCYCLRNFSKAKILHKIFPGFLVFGFQFSIKILQYRFSKTLLTTSLAKMSPSPAKRLKTSSENGSMADEVMERRISKAGENIEKFEFNMKRVKHLTGNEGFLHREAKGVAYYMHRDQRLQDNWAALFAQKLALADILPMYVIAGVNVKHPIDAEATRRSIEFSLDGLQEVAEECNQLGIEFHLLQDHEQPMHKRILNFLQDSKVGCVVADFSPLKPHRGQIEALKNEMEKLNGPCLYQVDGR